MPGSKRPRRKAEEEASASPAGDVEETDGVEAVLDRLSEFERRLIDFVREHGPTWGRPGMVREAPSVEYGSPAAYRARTPLPDYTPRPIPYARPRERRQGAAPAAPLRPEQYTVMGDYYRARRGFASDSQLAQALGVHRSRVSGWKSGDLPDRENARLLAGLGIVVDALLDFMDPDVVPDWLETGQYEARGRAPLDLLREGRLSEVLQLVNATETDAYV